MTARNETSALDSGLSRRRFVAGAATAAATISIVAPQTARGFAANEKINIGLVGCGGRGLFISKLFLEHGGYNLVGIADYFQDRCDKGAADLNVDASKLFTGLSGYKRLLQEKIDALVIESPPYFHPEQAAAAVEAGKHVYVAKPIAVDVPGCMSIEQSGKKATEKKLCFLVDFQTRADKFYVEALDRVHNGAIGKFAFGESTYHAENPWKRMIDTLKIDSPEARLRSWGLDRELSGDIITEQNIHTLDVASWIMDQPPLSAWGTGGQKVRNVGTCWDTFCVTFKYPDNVGIAFSSRQFDGYGTQPEGIRNRMFGADGVLETSYGGDVLIKGKNFWRGGKSPAIYKEGPVANIAAFHKAIGGGDVTNATVPPSVQSNLLTILGRTAAYKGETVTWNQLLASKDRNEFDTSALKS